MIKVVFVCHGNICRSPMAQSYFQNLVNEKGLADSFQVESAAARRDEIGNPPHHGTVGKLKEMGVPLVPHRATLLKKEDYEHEFAAGIIDILEAATTNMEYGDPVTITVRIIQSDSNYYISNEDFRNIDMAILSTDASKYEKEQSELSSDTDASTGSNTSGDENAAPDEEPASEENVSPDPDASTEENAAPDSDASTEEIPD